MHAPQTRVLELTAALDLLNLETVTPRINATIAEAASLIRRGRRSRRIIGGKIARGPAALDPTTLQNVRGKRGKHSAAVTPSKH